MSNSAGGKLLWGIDGGGTKTTILLAERVAEQSVKILTSVRAGSSNINSRPWDEITAELIAAMEQALQSASISSQPADALVAALAGVGSLTVRDQWHDWFANQNVSRKVQIVDDGAPLIAAGLPDGWGIVLIAGTGSVAFGRAPDGETARAGGWGYLIGDEGSAFAIGQAALRAMSHAYDRGEGLTPMMHTISQKWSLMAPREIVDRVYRSPEPRQRIAELAPLVCAAAGNGEPLAQDILRIAAEELSRMVQVVARQLGMCENPIPLAFSGGTAVNCKCLRDAITANLTTLKLTMEPVVVVKEPARGCIELARQLSVEQQNYSPNSSA